VIKNCKDKKAATGFTVLFRQAECIWYVTFDFEFLYYYGFWLQS